MSDAHKNFAVSAVATAPSPATSGTSLVVTAAQGARFPAVPFNATIWPAASQPTPANAEIVRVTAISTDTLTITRAQESSSARTVIVGDQIAATITAKTLTDVEGPSVNTKTATVATAEGTSSTTYTDLATTTDTVSATIGTSGMCIVIIGATISGSLGGAVGYASFAASGANTVAAADANAYAVGAVGGLTAGQQSYITTLTGLTAGSTTFKMKYRTTTGTATCSNRTITVIPL